MQKKRKNKRGRIGAPPLPVRMQESVGYERAKSTNTTPKLEKTHPKGKKIREKKLNSRQKGEFFFSAAV